MTRRTTVKQAAPDAYRALAGLERYVQANVDHQLLELVKLRASMINGCAFCIDMHSKDALKAGEASERLFGVAAWRETEFFTDRERIALALTEAVTQLGQHGVPDDVWDPAAAEFSPRELADLLVAIVTINVWNRVAIATRLTPGSPD